jgi:hypothetical protein
MKRKLFLATCLFVLASLFFGIRSVSAYTTIPVGKYQVEIGWVTEPPIAGQQNAIVVNLSFADSNPAQNGQIDISALKVDVVFGGETKTLTLQPLGENTPGQYVAPILPTRPGLYTIRLNGDLGNSKNISGEVQPEEVQPADALEFPQAANPQFSTGGFGLIGWLAVGGMLTGLAGLLVAVITLRKNR